MSDGTLTSGRCCVFGWVVVDHGSVRPCEVHRPEQHRRWVAGEYRPTPWDWFEDAA